MVRFRAPLTGNMNALDGSASGIYYSGRSIKYGISIGHNTKIQGIVILPYYSGVAIGDCAGYRWSILLYGIMHNHKAICHGPRYGFII